MISLNYFCTNYIICLNKLFLFFTFFVIFVFCFFVKCFIFGAEKELIQFDKEQPFPKKNSNRNNNSATKNRAFTNRSRSSPGAVTRSPRYRNPNQFHIKGKCKTKTKSKKKKYSKKKKRKINFYICL